MPVTDTHAEYKRRIPQWSRCRDTTSGTDAVKAAGAAYLPMLGGQTVEEYEAYKTRALFFGATKRTVQGLLGAVFRKDADVEFPDEDYLDNISQDGDVLFATSLKLVKEVIETGRAGILADVLGEGDPYLTLYGAEDIINWWESSVDGRKQLSKVVLCENYRIEGDDEFKSDIRKQYRVLEMAGVYQQRLFRKLKDDSEYTEVSEDENGTQYPLIPKRNGLPLDHIPFVIVNAYGIGAATEDPPLIDMVDVNLSHYRTSADYEHGAHYTALPTPWVAGFPTEMKLKIGSAIAWISSDPQAKAGILEYTGQGLNALADLAKSKENKMAVLGARMLEDQKKAAEAAETMHLRLSGESGALTTLVRSAGEGLEKALQWVAGWMKLTGDVTYQYNTDFTSVKMDPQLLVALMAARQAGEITHETFLYNLQQGELTRPDVTIEDEIAMLDNEPPVTLTE